MYKYPYMQKLYIILIPNILSEFIKVNFNKTTPFSMFQAKMWRFSLSIST